MQEWNPRSYHADVRRFDTESVCQGVKDHRLCRTWKEYARNRNTNGTMDLGIAQLNSQYLDYFAQQFNGGQWIDPFDPLVSIRIAARYLAWNHQSFGDWEYAVAAYNCGPGRARHRPWPETTERYVREVFR
jgi:hypothetical protein